MKSIDNQKRTTLKGLGLFLGGAAILNISACTHIPPSKIEFLERLYQREQNIKLIYRELPSYVHPIKIIGKFIPDDKKLLKKIPPASYFQGYGIVLNRHLVTSFELGHPYLHNTPKGTITGKLQNSQMIMNQEVLEEVKLPERSNIAIYKISKNLKSQFPDFPIEIGKNIDYGEEIFTIESEKYNPVHKGHITKVSNQEDAGRNRLSERDLIKDFYTAKILTTEIISEGAPIVNSKLELLGLVNFSGKTIAFKKIIKSNSLIQKLKNSSKNKPFNDMELQGDGIS